MMFLKCVPVYFGLSHVNINFVDLEPMSAMPVMTARIRSARRFNLASSTPVAQTEKPERWRQCITDRTRCRTFAPPQELTQRGGNGAPCHASPRSGISFDCTRL